MNIIKRPDAFEPTPDDPAGDLAAQAERWRRETFEAAQAGRR